MSPRFLTVIGLGVFLVLIHLAPAPASAATLTVNSTADGVDASPGNGQCATAGGQCTLRAAIQEANADPDADEIVVPAGAYQLGIPGQDEDAGATGDLDLLADVTIRGVSTGLTVINGASLDRVIDIPFGSTAVTATIQDLTLSAGLLPPVFGQVVSGGALRNFGTLSLQRVRIANNSASSGGALSNYGSAVIDASLIEQNQADFHCSGIDNETFASLEMLNTTIFNNTTSGVGGGLCVSSGGSANLVNVRIDYNIGASGGGGIHNTGSLTLFRTSVINNETGGRGGGIRNQNLGPEAPSNAVAFITESTIGDNGAVISGGGIDNAGFTTPGDATFGAVIRIERSTISGNVAGGTGGGIHNFGSFIQVANGTISSNRAGSTGGGISNRAETARSRAIVELESVTLHLNEADTGEGVFSASVGDGNVAEVSARNTIFAGAVNAYCSGVPVLSLGGNIDDDATCALGVADITNANALLGPLQNNGGWTSTHALSLGSPAIDAGPPDCPPPASDQRGVARASGAAGALCDIGAYEFLAFLDGDGDGIEDGVDIQPTVESTQFLDTTSLEDTAGVIGDRRGLSVLVEDLPSPAGVRASASGIGGPADIVISCDAGPIGLTLTSGDSVDITCGSTIITVLDGPIELAVGGLVIVIPDQSQVTIVVSDDSSLSLVNSPESVGSASVAGTLVAPGESIALGDVDADNDGIPDIDDACPNAPEDLDRFRDDDGCPEPCRGGDVDGDDKVNLRDFLLVIRALGSQPGSRNWNPAADFNQNGRIDLGDVFLVLRSLSDPTCR